MTEVAWAGSESMSTDWSILFK